MQNSELVRRDLILVSGRNSYIENILHSEFCIPSSKIIFSVVNHHLSQSCGIVIKLHEYRNIQRDN